MSDDSAEPKPSTPESQQAFCEAAERERRVQVWLQGTLAGGPPLGDAVKQWRQRFAICGDSAEIAAEDKDGQAAGTSKLIEDSLPEIRRNIRERRELSSKPSLKINQEESERRAATVIESIQKDRFNGKEATPLHLVLAARYVEGEIDYEEYCKRIDS